MCVGPRPDPNQHSKLPLAPLPRNIPRIPDGLNLMLGSKYGTSQNHIGVKDIFLEVCVLGALVCRRQSGQLCGRCMEKSGA
jgi:hypothetical protein